ncbi:MAG: SDR family oxidoreductase, partial [Alphaproteobacteria bacterium]|nr:SDR family oxidoreductase [Alphaproteobacteria bacterium]
MTVPTPNITESQTGLLAARKGLVMGVANDRSLAWGIARAADAQGAELAFTYQGETLEKRVRPLAESVGSSLVLPCDVTDEDSVEATFAAVADTWGSLDFVIHAIAYSDKEELKGRYLDTSAKNFQSTLNISCFSFTSLCRHAAPL